MRRMADINQTIRMDTKRFRPKSTVWMRPEAEVRERRLSSNLLLNRNAFGFVRKPERMARYRLSVK